MNDGSKYVGLDVHKETVAISIAEASVGEVRYYGEIKNNQGGRERKKRAFEPILGSQGRSVPRAKPGGQS